jgi:hypothetical protein
MDLLQPLIDGQAQCDATPPGPLAHQGQGIVERRGQVEVRQLQFHTDPRWVSTLRAIERELVSDSLVYRYRLDDSFSDGLTGQEGYVLDVLVLVC